MDRLFGLDPNVANTVITAITTLIAAVVGGVIAAWATRGATKRALKHSLTMEQRNRGAVLRGVLLGIRTELELLLEIYRGEMELEMESLKEGQGIHVTLPIYQNVFTVYESNCSLIGQIEDDELRKAIIRTYLLAKSLVNAHTYNNKLIEEYDAQMRDGTNRLFQQNAFRRIQDYGSQVKLSYEEAKDSLNKCFALMDRSDLFKEAPESAVKTLE
ncbi:MAG TPA: hypothetical protein VIW64_00185 [Pyrinomonadaceae bacterium]|jgi:hypothetical protein